MIRLRVISPDLKGEVTTPEGLYFGNGLYLCKAVIEESHDVYEKGTDEMVRHWQPALIVFDEEKEKTPI